MTSAVKDLLSWYQKNRILYPWRKTKDPYKIWLSEILLQQTRIPVVLKYYEKIVHRFPRIEDLTAARESEFLALWSGLGYYKRAHDMLKCARIVTQKYEDKFPGGVDELLSLPGIGPYTAGAIRNICFGKLTPSLDGNIRRVLSRIAMTHDDLESFFLKMGKGTDSGDFFQSMMELGEQVCLPDPRCAVCPVRKFCKAYRNNRVLDFPKKKIKKKTETFHWYLLFAELDGAHYYVQNSRREFLKNAWIFPDILSKTELSPALTKKQFARTWGIQMTGFVEKKTVAHTVTFRKIHAHLLVPETYTLNGSKGKWLKEEDFQTHPTSSIRRKILRIK